MPKTLEGYIGDQYGQPIEGVPATVTRVIDGAPVAFGASQPDGRWVFSDLDEAQEHFVTLLDAAGRAAVRGPWSGELREAWVRDRLNVAGKPLIIDPDADNELTWGPAGLFAPAGITEASADTRYVNAAGTDTKTGRLNLYEATSGDFALVVGTAGTPTNYFLLQADGTMSWGLGASYDTVLARSSAGVLSLGGSPLLTQASGDALFLTQAEGDARYTQGGITQAAADLRYEPLDSAYTKAEDDARFVNLAGGSVMTGLLGPTTTNTRDLGTTVLRWRALYGMTADLTTSLTVASKPLVISPDASNIIEWRPNGFYAAAGAVSDIWVNTTGDTMTGDLNMTANVLPTVTNTRDLGSTSLRWQKVWAVDADFTNAPTVGGSALLTATAADALFLTPAEGNAAYSIAAHTHAALYEPLDSAYTKGEGDARYVLLTGGAMTGQLSIQRDASTSVLFLYAAVGSTDGGIRLRNRRSRGTMAAPAVLNGTDTIGYSTYEGLTTGLAWVETASIRGMADGAAGASFQAGAIVIATSDGTALPADRLRIDSVGRVRVNPLTDPALPAGYTATPGLLVQHEGAAQYNALSLARAASDTNGGMQTFWRARGTWSSKVAIANGDELSNIFTFGWSGSNWLLSNAIQTVVSGTVTTTAIPTLMRFYTADSAGVLAARLHIGPAGLVGLGAKADGSAQATLDVQSSAAATSAGFIRGHASALDALAWFRALRGADNLCIMGANNLGWVNDLISATAIGTFATKRIPVYNSSGTLQGYLPLYS